MKNLFDLNTAFGSAFASIFDEAGAQSKHKPAPVPVVKPLPPAARIAPARPAKRPATCA